jgi:hypothetical protein
MALVIGIGFLALFSLVSILLSPEDGRQSTERRDALYTWIRTGIR